MAASCNFQLEPIKPQRSSHPETPLLERSVTQTIEHTRRGFIMFFVLKLLTLRVAGVWRVVGKLLDVFLQQQLVPWDPLWEDKWSPTFLGFNFFLRNRLLHLDWGEHVVLQREVPALRHCLGNPH